MAGCQYYERAASQEGVAAVFFFPFAQDQCWPSCLASRPETGVVSIAGGASGEGAFVLRTQTWPSYFHHDAHAALVLRNNHRESISIVVENGR